VYEDNTAAASAAVQTGFESAENGSEKPGFLRNSQTRTPAKTPRTHLEKAEKEGKFSNTT